MTAIRRHSSKWTICAAVVLAVSVASAHHAARADGPAGDCLNVQDYGASGSTFETKASATAGSKKITVADPGDFKPGQGVMLSKCNVRYEKCQEWDGMYSRKPAGNAVELRGYDGTAGSWLIYIIDVDGTQPSTFRFSDDVARSWKKTKIPITGDWQPLSKGIEIRFSKRKWQPGNVISFEARDLLMTTIEKIEGKVVTLKDAANRSVNDAVLRHEDSATLQAVITRAVKEKRNVFLPNGLYRLRRGLTVSGGEGIHIEGASGENTVLDISEGIGSILRLKRGKAVTVRNLRMVGHSGLAEKAGFVHTSGGYGIWGITFKPCNAVSTSGTERVLIENVHASRMSAECFYASGPCREADTIHGWTEKSGKNKPRQYTKQITYLHCSVTDCGFNAFNNNDLSESTSMLYCRVENIGNCFWEGPGRFIRIIGCYARNAGVCSVGNMFHRYEFMHDLGVAQTIVANNVFEGKSCNRAAVHVGHCATEVVIRDNLFVNYGSTAVNLDCRGKCDFPTEVTGRIKSSYPARHVAVTGNIIDLTYKGEKPQSRTGIRVSLSDVIVGDNQIYVRGEADANVTGLRIEEPAVNVTMHDNLVRNCNLGLAASRFGAQVGRVDSDRAFLRKGRSLPLEWRYSHLYRRWNLVWLAGNKPSAVSILERFDPDTLQFRLTAPRQMKEGDRFEMYPPSANWNIHDNTITACTRPVVLDCYGSPTSLLRGNTISRGAAAKVTAGVTLNGQFSLIGNQISRFDEPGSAALVLGPDRFGKMRPNIVRDNTFQDCAQAVKELVPGTWKASQNAGNLFIRCSGTPEK